MEPIVLSKTFPEELRDRLLDDCDLIRKRGRATWEPDFGRSVSNDGRLYLYAEHLLPLVRNIFNDDSILPSYNCWARYSSPSARLRKHKDSNACTFTVDYCVRQRDPWPLVIEDREYSLLENESVVFMGEDQEHWRTPFKPGNMVEMVFFHFVRPDHWYFQ